MLLIFSIFLITSCHDANDTDLSDYEVYEICKDRSMSAESFTRYEDVKFSFENEDLFFDFISDIRLKFNDNDKEWELLIIINDEMEAAKCYYKDGDLYIDAELANIVISVPEHLARPEVISFFKEFEEKDVINSRSKKDNEGVTTINFVIEGGKSISKFNTLIKYGTNRFELIDISVSDIDVTVIIDKAGYLISKEMKFEITPTIKYDGQQYEGVLRYDGTSRIDSINKTEVSSPNFVEHTRLDFDEAKKLYEELSNNISN